MLDFNDADDQLIIDNKHLDKDDLKRKLIARLPEVLHHLFPKGKIVNNAFRVGDLDGNPGHSLSFALYGHEAGLFIDHANEKNTGDIFSAWVYVKRINPNDFRAVLASVAQWLGDAPAFTANNPPRPLQPLQETYEDLGMYTAMYKYWLTEKELYAVVYRYDTPTGKQFRPYDVKTGKSKAPSPRILYNLPQVKKAQRVILVEGEKCVDALTVLDVVATTAMFGSKAPLDKTDWTPLNDKEVIVWLTKTRPVGITLNAFCNILLTNTSQPMSKSCIPLMTNR